MGEEMTIFICITVLSCILLWMAATEKKAYSQDDMLWALYVTGKEQRVRENGAS